MTTKFKENPQTQRRRKNTEKIEVVENNKNM